MLEELGGDLAFGARKREEPLQPGDQHRSRCFAGDVPCSLADSVDFVGEERLEESMWTHGVDVDPEGYGTVVQQRIYQLIRQAKPIRERRYEFHFLDDGAEDICFTFG